MDEQTEVITEKKCSKSCNYNPGKRKEWNAKNREKKAEYLREWRRKNPEKQKEANKRADVKKMGTTKGRLNNIMSCGIRFSLVKGTKDGRHWERLVGFTLGQLKKHLEKQFKDGMTWENRGKWQVDHKVPKAAFNFESPGDLDFKRCWALKNLQPMWATDNFKKNDKLDKPFQPSLSIRMGT